jgi:hypothetical protein
VNHIEKDLLQKRIEIANWIVLAVLFLPALILAPLKFALGILLGGFICILNFHWLGRSLQGAFQKLGNSGNIKTPVMVRYYLRMGVTGIILYLLIDGGAVDVIGLIVGLSVVVINIIITLIATAMLKKNTLEEVS